MQHTLELKILDARYGGDWPLPEYATPASAGLDLRAAVQEALVKAYRSLSSYDTARPFSTWLYRVCVNTCIDRKRRVRDLPTDEPIILVDASQGARLEREDVTRAVQHALTRLDETYRVALVLKDVEDLDYETMSEILGESVPALKIRVIRARQRLAKVLRKLHPELVPPV